MGKPAARLGDPTVHGGVIVVGFPMVMIGGMPAARIADMHVCPMVTGIVPHVGGPIALGSPMVLIGGMPAARMGDMVVCAGPPDSIIMGCPTVLIGEGGSGSASGGGAGSSGAGSAQVSAKNALTDNVEASTKQEHWIEFEFVDKAGNPVSSIPYKLKDPDGKESQNLLKPDGRILRDATGKGKGEVILFKVQNAKWSKEIVKIGEKVKLSAESEGFDDGKVATIQIYKKDINAADTIVKTLEQKVSGNKIEIELENNFEGEENNSSKKYSSASYYFEVIIGQCKSRSGFLFNEDFIELELKDTEGNPKANEEFTLFLPNGKVESGKLDANGYKKIEKIPAGRYSVKFPNLNKNLKK
ncbi:MAG TPA: PAAR domain-containing protein [Ignavibacteriaceae bacterium]|nr:PAAR domain-containing protein [Ignavibacteriaceae bacterium]